MSPRAIRVPFFLALCVAAALTVGAGTAPLFAQDAAPAAQAAPARPLPPQPEGVAAAAGSLVETVEVRDELPTEAAIATKVPLELEWTPAAVSVVPATLLEEQGALVLGDALENVPGVNVQTQAGTTDFFLVRGFDSVSSGLVLTDGAAEPEATWYHLYNVDRVEVLKGPGAFLYGGNPLAGAVSLVRKQPHAGRIVAGEARVGSFGALGADVDVNFELGATSRLRVNALYDEADGYRDDKDRRSFAINPVLDWAPSDRGSLQVSAELVDNRHSPDAGLPLLPEISATGFVPSRLVPDVPRTRSYQSPFDESKQEIARLRLDFDRMLSPTVTVRGKTYFTRLEWESTGTIFNGVVPFPPAGLFVARTLVDLDDRQDFVGQQLEALLAASTGAVDHQITVGVELARQQDVFGLGIAFLGFRDVFSDAESLTSRPPPIPGFGASGDARSDIVAPYVLDRMIVTPRLEVLLGARLDVLSYEDAVSGVENDDEHLSPVLGVVWAPADGWSLYANASEGFAPPSTLVQSPGREFEESRGVEAGVKRVLADGRIVATLAAYELERENIGIPDDNGVTQQAGDQRSRGVELDLGWHPRAGTTLRLAYAYNDAELVRFAQRVQVSAVPPLFLTLDRSGNAPAFAPEHLLNAWASHRIGRLGLALGARYVGEQFIAENNAFQIEDALTFDAAASFDVGRCQLAVNLRNLIDEDTFVRGFGDASVIPADPFAVTGAVRLRM